MVVNSIECFNDCEIFFDFVDVIYDNLIKSNYLLCQVEYIYLLVVDFDGDNEIDYLLMLEINYLVDVMLYMCRNSNWYVIDIEDLGLVGIDKMMIL